MDKKLRLVRQMQLGCALAVAILAALSVISYRSVVGLREGDRWVRHTHEVMEHLGEMFSSVQDVESGARAFALSGEDSFLDLYYSGRPRAQAQVELMRRLTTDNAIQQQRLDALAKWLSRKSISAMSSSACVGNSGRKRQ